MPNQYQLAKSEKRYTVFFKNEDDQPQTISETAYLNIKKLILSVPFIEINGNLESVSNIRRILPHENEKQNTFPGLSPEVKREPTPEEHARSREQLKQVRRELILKGVFAAKPEDYKPGGCMEGEKTYTEEVAQVSK